MLQKIDPDGSLSLRSIAERLNQMNVPTISGKGSWSANSVRRLKAVSWPEDTETIVLVDIQSLRFMNNYNMLINPKQLNLFKQS